MFHESAGMRRKTVSASHARYLGNQTYASGERPVAARLTVDGPAGQF
jgi:hypothetical protein